MKLNRLAQIGLIFVIAAALVWIGISVLSPKNQVSAAAAAPASKPAAKAVKIRWSNLYYVGPNLFQHGWNGKTLSRVMYARNAKGEYYTAVKWEGRFTPKPRIAAAQKRHRYFAKSHRNHRAHRPSVRLAEDFPQEAPSEPIGAHEGGSGATDSSILAHQDQPENLTPVTDAIYHVDFDDSSQADKASLPATQPVLADAPDKGQLPGDSLSNDLDKTKLTDSENAATVNPVSIDLTGVDRGSLPS